MKKVICIVMAIFMVLLLVACGGETAVARPSATAGSDSPATTPGKTEPTTPSNTVKPDTTPVATVEPTTAPTVAPTVAPTSTPEPKDPLEILTTTKEDALEWGFFCLKQGKNLYSLGRYTRKVSGVSYDEAGLSLNKEVWLYTTFMYDDNAGFVSYGDIEIPVLEKGSKVIYYSNSNVPTLRLKEVKFSGYSVCVIENDSNKEITDVYGNKSYSTASRDIKNVEVTDSKGKTVDNYHDLERGQYYTVSWFEGTTYREIKVPADGRYYTIADGDIWNWDYEIEGKLTKEGYAEYDLSDVPSGIYLILGNGGLIEK